MGRSPASRRAHQTARRGPGRPAGRTATEGVIADRETLLAAAERLVRQHGPGVSLEAIAGEAGVTKPILYRTVGDKDALVHALAERLAARMADDVARLVATASTPLGGLRSLVGGYLRHAAHDRHLYNPHGGRENLDAIAFLRRMNDHVLETHPDVLTIAEESTSWPMVTRSTAVGGLGFRMKWDMGWMNDTLEYMELDPVHRAFHHGNLTFRPMYAYSESFVLPLSHDEVVHLKGSLLFKMPGDEWQKFANLRLLFGYQAAVPGKKLLFMGGEIGQWAEWDHDSSVQWHLLGQPFHEGVRRWVADLNRLHASEPALHALDFDPAGFEWVDFRDSPQSVISFLRKSTWREDAEIVLCLFNFTPVPRHGYRIGVPRAGVWREIANGDAHDYGGSGIGNAGSRATDDEPKHGKPWSLALEVPPLAALFLKAPAVTMTEPEPEEGRRKAEGGSEPEPEADPRTADPARLPPAASRLPRKTSKRPTKSAPKKKTDREPSL